VKEDGCRGAPSPRPSILIQSQSTGNARARRQKAVALGPSSLSRTKIGANAIPAAPPNNAPRATRADLSWAFQMTESPRPMAGTPTLSSAVRSEEGKRMERLEKVVRKLREFVAEREWEQFHDPKNLVMAVASEAGELLAEYRWGSNAGADEDST